MIYDIQKASILKRISAFLLDFILLCILTVGFIYLLSAITNLDKYINTLQTTYNKYEEIYGVKFDISADEYEKMTEEQRANYDAAAEALNAELAQSKAFSMTYSILLMCISIGLFLSFMILEFALPLIFKNGQTVGMKVFSLCVVFTNGVRVSTFAMFVRSILGKYTLETMIPVLIVFMLILGSTGIIGLIVLLALLVLQVALFAVTKNRCFVHDIVSNTVIVDKAAQMIFNNYDELVSYKEKLAAEEAENAKY